MRFAGHDTAVANVCTAFIELTADHSPAKNSKEKPRQSSRSRPSLGKTILLEPNGASGKHA
jgi:hypothetical protein